MADRENQKNESINRGARNARRPASRSARPEASVNMDELRELIALLRENGLAEFELEREGFRVRLRRESDFSEPANHFLAPQAPEKTHSTSSHRGSAITQPGAPLAPLHPGAQAETAASEDQDLHIIPSPIVGTFYRAPSPNAEPFVKINSHVEADSVVCIIEAMKLMNEIQAEVTGDVAKIYVENGQPVEYGQPLFGVRR